MNDFEEKTPSAGELLAKYLYEKPEEPRFAKKNSQPINVKIDKNDLEIVDYFSEKFGVTKNWIISFLIESNIEEMFKAFGVKSKYELAIIADDVITKKNLPHEFRGATWYWDVVQPDPAVENPEEKGL